MGKTALGQTVGATVSAAASAAVNVANTAALAITTTGGAADADGTTDEDGDSGVPPGALDAVLAEWSQLQAEGETSAGINVRKGRITNIMEENVIVPLLVHTSAITLATECVRLILKIDDIVITR